MAADAEQDEERPPPAGVEGFAWLFGMAEVLAPAAPAVCEAAEAPPRAA